MSKPVKEMIVRMYEQLFAEVNDAVLVDIRGLESNENNDFRTKLAEQGIRVTVVKKSLARKAFAETGLAPINELLSGPSAMVYGGDSVVGVARELVDCVKQYEKLELKGAVMEGQVYQADQVKALSEMPTKEEAQAQVVQLLLSPAGQVISAATSAGSAIASILKTIEEKGGEVAKSA